MFPPTVLLLLPNGGTVACSPRMRSYIVRKFSFLVSVSLQDGGGDDAIGILQHLRGRKCSTIGTGHPQGVVVHVGNHGVCDPQQTGNVRDERRFQKRGTSA